MSDAPDRDEEAVEHADVPTSDGDRAAVRAEGPTDRDDETAGEAAPDPDSLPVDEEPRALSPLSVPYRAVRRGASVAFTLLFVVVSGSSFLGGAVGQLVGVALVGVAVVALVGYEVTYWSRYEYALTVDTFDIRSGVFRRRNREIPVDRIQNVDISRNVVQRLLGIAAVDLETAGGGATEAAVRYVTFEEAKRLQRTLAARKRTREREEPVDEDGAEPLFELEPRELGLVGLLSFDLRTPGLVVFVVYGLVTAGGSGSPLPVPGGGLALALGAVGLGVLLVGLSWAAGAVAAVLNYYDFRLTRVDDELQYERGLLRRYDGSIPLDKVQTLTVVDDPLKRYFGYAALYVETAGYAPGGSDDRGSQAAVPIARRERVLALVEELEGVAVEGLERPPKRVRRRYAARYLIAVGVLAGVGVAAERLLLSDPVWVGPLLLVPLVPVAAHLKWRHRGYALGDGHVLTRNGVLRRETKAVPYYRVQTVIDSRTIFQRRWSLGTVTADTAGSLSLAGNDAAAVDVDDETAARLRETLVDRLYDSLDERHRDRQIAPPGADEWPATGDDAAEANGDGRDARGPRRDDDRPETEN
ncbi:MAG: PH domain-containing protein [Haloferacaceae archaeon]